MSPIEHGAMNELYYLLITFIGDIINSIDPKYYASGKLPRGNPELDRTVTSIFKNEKSKELLGITYKEAEEIFADVVGLFDAHWWLSY